MPDESPDRYERRDAERVRSFRRRHLTELEIAALHAAGIRTVELEIDGSTLFSPDPHDVQAFLSQLYDDGETLAQRYELAQRVRGRFTPTEIEQMARHLCATSMTFAGQGMIERLLDRIDELKADIEQLTAPDGAEVAA